MSESTLKKGRAVILTALPVEYNAVKAHLRNLSEETHPRGDVYQRGTFVGARGAWDVLIGQIGEGGPRAAAAINRAIEYFDPGVVLFVGVAGGIKDAALYDVVAARKVYGYESGKAEEEFLPRPEVGNASFTLEQRARAEATNGQWVRRIHGPKPTETPHVFIKPIAAGEKVVASKKSAIYTFLRKAYSDAVAVEMEGHGFLLGVDMNEQVKGLVIRGISDLLDNKEEADAHGSQEIASCYASAFAFELLARLDTGDPSKKQPSASTSSSRQGSIEQAQKKSSGDQDTDDASEPFEIFYSYAKEDARLLKQLQNQLAILKRQNLITDWYKVVAGGKLTQETIGHLKTARVILLLISPDFIASEHHYKVELKRAMERHEADEVVVIPILLRPTDDWKNTPFGELQAIPRNGRAITQWPNRDLAFAEVTREIREVVEQLKRPSSSKGG